LRTPWNLRSCEVPPRSIRKVAVTEADSISGCCHAVIRFPSHFRSPHPSPRYPWSVHPFLFRSLSLAVSRPRSSRASNERRCLKVHTGVRQADKFTRDARVGSRAVRTSVHVARGADTTSGGERSTQRALSLSEDTWSAVPFEESSIKKSAFNYFVTNIPLKIFLFRVKDSRDDNNMGIRMLYSLCHLYFFILRVDSSK